MGRHSAPAQDEEQDFAGALAVEQSPGSGRHSRSERVAEPGAPAAPAEGIGLIEEALAAGSPIPPRPMPGAEDETVVIAAIADPVIDQSRPDADTAQLPVIVEAAPEAPTVTLDLADPTGSFAASRPVEAVGWVGTVEPVEPVEPVGAVAEPVDAVAEPRLVAQAGAPQPVGRVREHATQADLALLRRRRDVRARGIAAVLAPFVVYVAVMFATGKQSSIVEWVWIPIVVAGVLFGAVLDSAHKREKGQPGPAAAEITESADRP